MVHRTFSTIPHRQAFLHRPPRDFGFKTGLWTLSLVAKLCVKQGWIKSEVSSETIRQTLKRLGINWKRAKHWITSPDPLYFKKNYDGKPDLQRHSSKEAR
jgi:transposase